MSVLLNITGNTGRQGSTLVNIYLEEASFEDIDHELQNRDLHILNKFNSIPVKIVHKLLLTPAGKNQKTLYYTFML